MLNRRWWDVAVAAGSVVIALSLALGFRPDEPADLAVGLFAIVLFAVAYVVVARPAIGAAPGWRLPVFVALAAIAVGVGASAAGFLAMLQALAYPLVWVIADSRRRAVAGSAVLAFAVACGFAVEGDLAPGAIAAGLVTAGFSFAFAVALGLWIASIVEYGEERAALVSQLTAAHAEVESLSRDRGAAQERERLARDLHDTLAQSLTGLVILAERAGRQSRAGEQDAAIETIATVERIAREALSEARALVARTAAVPSGPAFGSSIERLASRFREEAGLTIDVDVPDGLDPLDRESEVVLLRCLQEGLANVGKHADATRVFVRVWTTVDGGAALDVADDGCGFDPSAPRSGYGIDGMSERVALAGGTFDVSSRPGEGTTLRVRLPASGPESSPVGGRRRPGEARGAP